MRAVETSTRYLPGQPVQIDDALNEVDQTGKGSDKGEMAMVKAS